MLVVDVALLTLVVSVVLPILVGLVTKKLANSRVKAALLLLFAAVAGLANQAIVDGGLLTQEAVVAGVVAYVVAVATHYGFYKPTGITNGVQSSTENFGVG